jgi:hypothetical protein
MSCAGLTYTAWRSFQQQRAALGLTNSFAGFHTFLAQGKSDTQDKQDQLFRWYVGCARALTPFQQICSGIFADSQRKISRASQSYQVEPRRRYCGDFEGTLVVLVVIHRCCAVCAAAFRLLWSPQLQNRDGLVCLRADVRLAEILGGPRRAQHGTGRVRQ